MELNGNHKIPPLRKVLGNGKRLRRSKATEKKIKICLKCKRDELDELLSLPRPHKRHVPSEAVVYLVHASFNHDDAILELKASRALENRIGRVAPFVLLHCAVPPHLLQDAQAEAVDTVFTQIVTKDPAHDFYQVNFNAALRRRLIDAARRTATKFGEFMHSVLEEASVPAPDIPSVGPESGNKWIAELRAMGPKCAMGAQALLAITDPRHREAFILTEFANWQVENMDPHQPSLVKKYGKSASTIHGWLRAAKQQFDDWIKGNTA